MAEGQNPEQLLPPEPMDNGMNNLLTTIEEQQRFVMEKLDWCDEVLLHLRKISSALAESMRRLGKKQDQEEVSSLSENLSAEELDEFVHKNQGLPTEEETK